MQALAVVKGEEGEEGVVVREEEVEQQEQEEDEQQQLPGYGAKTGSPKTSCFETI